MIRMFTGTETVPCPTLIEYLCRRRLDDRLAAQIARAVANSPLVKTAMAGADPNWGRIICAAGNAGVAFDPAKTDIELQGTVVCRGGLAPAFPESALNEQLEAPYTAIKFPMRR